MRMHLTSCRIIKGSERRRGEGEKGEGDERYEQQIYHKLTSHRFITQLSHHIQSRSGDRSEIFPTFLVCINFLYFRVRVNLLAFIYHHG